MPQTPRPTDTTQRATPVKNQDKMDISVACSINNDKKLKRLKVFLETKTMAPTTLNQTTTRTIITTTTTTKTVTQVKESQKLFIRPVRHLGRQTTVQRNATLRPMQPTDRPPGTKERKDRIRSKKVPIKVIPMKLFKLQSKI